MDAFLRRASVPECDVQPTVTGSEDDGKEAGEARHAEWVSGQPVKRETQGK
jgi:hypothetical protein